MPTLHHALLEALTPDIFQAIGTPPGGAAWMAKLLVRANLRGHDSHGVIRVPKRNRKEALPHGWVLDAQGQPTTDPNAIYREPQGTILPVGGHKGYGLALMVDVLGGILARAGYSRENPGHVMNGVVDIARFVGPGTFRQEVDDLIRYLKSLPADDPGRVDPAGPPERLSAG